MLIAPWEVAGLTLGAGVVGRRDFAEVVRVSAGVLAGDATGIWLVAVRARDDFVGDNKLLETGRRRVVGRVDCSCSEGRPAETS